MSKNIGIDFGWKKCAGLVSFWIFNFALHLFCSKEHWIWGFEKDWYDGPIYYFGCGPLFLICWG